MNWQDLAMDIVFWGLPTLGLFSVIAREFSNFLFYLYEKTKPVEVDGRVTLQMPMAYRLLAVAGLSAILGIVLWDFYSSFERSQHFVIPDPIVFSILVLLAASQLAALFYYRNYRIILDRNGILLIGLFKKQKEILWKEITRIDFIHSSFLVFADKRMINVAGLLSGIELFVGHLRKYVKAELATNAIEGYRSYVNTEGEEEVV